MKKDFLSIADLNKDEILEIFDKATMLKEKPWSASDALKNKIIGLIFEKPSNRTRLSFEVGSIQLGATPIYMGREDMEFGKREPVKDIARVLSRYIDLVILRTFRHSHILEFAKYATIPVINGLSDLFHPCQALSDMFTIKEKLKDLHGKTLCFIGDANNVLNSLLYCSSKMGLNIKVATPKEYKPKEEILKNALAFAKSTGARIELYHDPKQAIKNADIVYTDVWVSMGQEKEKYVRIKAFKDFKIDSKLLNLAKRNAFVMHCLPAHRGEEITDEVIEGKNSIVFDQAENRLHVQKALLLKLLR